MFEEKVSLSAGIGSLGKELLDWSSRDNSTFFLGRRAFEVGPAFLRLRCLEASCPRWEGDWELKASISVVPIDLTKRLPSFGDSGFL